MYTLDQLLKEIETQGIDNIRFTAPMKKVGVVTPVGILTSSSDPDVPTVCKITQKRHRVSERYKIDLTPAEYEGYVEQYYASDLASLIDRGIIKVVASSKSEIAGGNI